MRILILNDRPWHYECYIHIIDFCIAYNIEVDILEAYSDSLGVKEFYLNHFRDNIRYVKGVNKLKDKCLADPFTNIKYDKVFLVTDNFIKTQYFNYFKSLEPNSSADDQLIFIDHSNEIRNRFSNHIDIRHFPDKNNNYAYTCIDLISKEEKQEFLSQEKQTNILISANPSNINITKEIQTLNDINPNAHIHWVSRDLSKLKQFKLNNISYYESLNQTELNELFKKSHYVYVPKYHNKNYRTESTTGILGFAYSYLCQVVWGGANYNKHYRLYSPFEYSKGLGVDDNSNINLVAKERRELINHRNKVFSSFLTESKINLLYFKGRNFGNFGDELSPYIVKKILNNENIAENGNPENHKKNLIALGSYIQTAQDNFYIFGSGVRALFHDLNFNKLNIISVRGPLTRKVLLAKNIDCPQVYGDPALLLPEFYQPDKITNLSRKIGVVPHLSQIQNFKNPNPAKYFIIDPTQYWKVVIDQIYSCKCVLASSLHGLICADAYNIPNLWFRQKIQEGNFKFLDYFASQGRKKVYISSLEEFCESKLYNDGNKIDMNIALKKFKNSNLLK